MNELEQYCLSVAQAAREASRKMALVSGTQKTQWLKASAARLRAETETLLAANKLDLDAAPGYGLTSAMIDRLTLTPQRIEGIAVALEEVAALPNPVGGIIHSTIRPNGIEVQKVRVPLGVIFFIYESRPNVTADAAALCVKSGNAVILRGGKEAIHSSQAIVNLLCEEAIKAGLPENAIQFVNTIDRNAVGYFLKLNQYIDVCIPRGGESLIRRVTADATMPVIKHFNGNCHVYIDQSAPEDMAVKILLNAKTQRMGVCNAAESLVVHRGCAERLLPVLAKALQDKGVEIHGDETTAKLCQNIVPATEEDYKTEYLGPKISCIVVDSIEDAIEHINKYSSGHTEAIVTQDLNAARLFTQAIDSSAVMVNASTRFNDGGEFGLGAEIGISTDKLHARGPCGPEELTTYKYVVYGDGQVRE